jgi:hypothetical protein
LEGPAADAYLSFCMRVMFAPNKPPTTSSGGGGGASAATPAAADGAAAAAGGGGAAEADGGLGEFRQLFRNLWEDAVAVRQGKAQEEAAPGRGEEGDGAAAGGGVMRAGAGARRTGRLAAAGRGGGNTDGFEAAAEAAGGTAAAAGADEGGGEEGEPPAHGRYALGSGAGRTDPDYAALLAAAAAYARVSPCGLHRQVAALEGRCVDAEAAVQLRRAAAAAAGGGRRGRGAAGA